MVFLGQPQNTDLIAPTVYVFTPIFIIGGQYITGQTIARSQVKIPKSFCFGVCVVVFSSRFLGGPGVGLLHCICSVVNYWI